MYLLEDEATTRPQYANLLRDMAARICSVVPWDRSHWYRSRPPEGDVLAESRFKLSASMPFAAYLHGIDGIKAGIDQIRQQGTYATAAMQHHLDIGKLFARRHIRAWRGLKNSRYIRGEIWGPFCIPRSSPKRMMSINGPPDQDTSRGS